MFTVSPEEFKRDPPGQRGNGAEVTVARTEAGSRAQRQTRGTTRPTGVRRRSRAQGLTGDSVKLAVRCTCKARLTRTPDM